MCIRSFRLICSHWPKEVRVQKADGGSGARGGVETAKAWFPLIFPVSQCVYNSTTAGFHGVPVNELQMPHTRANQGAAVSHHGPQVPPSCTGTLLLFLLQASRFTASAPLPCALLCCAAIISFTRSYNLNLPLQLLSVSYPLLCFRSGPRKRRKRRGRNMRECYYIRT